MLKMSDLPFQVGELIESKTFLPGYRGAWFRCKIIKIGKKDGVLSYRLVYPDYDKESSQIKVYQIPSHITKSKGSSKVLMVRPRFPTVYRENEKLDVNAISEVIVIINDTWKVGDLVDWFTDGCYWCGKVTRVFGNGKAQIDLLPPPLGEGASYEVLTKDLRPSLDWCPEKGWTVPMPTEDGCRCPARIMTPAKSGNIENKNATTDGAVNTRHPMERRACRNIKEADNKNERTCFADIVSTSHNLVAPIENSESTAINNRSNDESPAKKMRISSNLFLNSMFSNTPEAAILDLEELVNRVKWLRCVLMCEGPLSGRKDPSWKFLPHQCIMHHANK